MNKCEHKELVHVECMGDYDGILYHGCKDCGQMTNVHTLEVFDTIKNREEFGLNYQFRDGKLVSYSIYKAEGLSVDDNLNDVKNELWGTRGKHGTSETIFKPLKDMSYLHIKAILRDHKAGRLRVPPRHLAHFKSIKEISYDIIKAGKH